MKNGEPRTWCTMGPNRCRLYSCGWLRLFGFVGLVSLAGDTLASGGGQTQQDHASTPSGAPGIQVDHATGDLSYTLELGEVRTPSETSFPIRLGYKSGVRYEQDATWVGLGWVLDAGSVTRTVVGWPDDYLGADVNNFLDKGLKAGSSGTPVLLRDNVTGGYPITLYQGQWGGPFSRALSGLDFTNTIASPVLGSMVTTMW
jgi:hypothetical protein